MHIRVVKVMKKAISYAKWIYSSNCAPGDNTYSFKTIHVYEPQRFSWLPEWWKTHTHFNVPLWMQHLREFKFQLPPSVEMLVHLLRKQRDFLSTDINELTRVGDYYQNCKRTRSYAKPYNNMIIQLCHVWYMQCCVPHMAQIQIRCWIIIPKFQFLIASFMKVESATHPSATPTKTPFLSPSQYKGTR